VADRIVSALCHAAFWLPLGVCTWLALAPAPPDAIFRISDVILHAAAFAWLAFAMQLAFPRAGAFAAGAWMLGFGALIELAQAAGGVRVGEFRDLAVDLAGIGAGLAAYRLAGTRIRMWMARAVRVLVS
jgi:hypothetical protein